MSQLRLGHLPDGTRQVLIQEPAVGRVTHARGSIGPAFTLNPVTVEVQPIGQPERIIEAPSPVEAHRLEQRRWKARNR